MKILFGILMLGAAFLVGYQLGRSPGSPDLIKGAVNLAKDAARGVRSTNVSGDPLSVLERSGWLIVERKHWNGPPRGRDP